MTRILRWLLRIAIAGASLALAGALLAWVLISGSLPRYEGEVPAAGLEAPVTVTRDANAVPHIRAGTERDAWFALGMMHAQDRLWQMEIARRSAQGRLSALLGPRTVPLDRLAKTLDIYGHASRAVRHQYPRARAALEAYAAGVNAWIRHVDANSLGRGAPEFFLFGGEGFAPWTPADSLGILKMMALRLSNGARTEVRRALFQLALPPERVADVLPEYPLPATTTVPRYGTLFPGARFAAVGAPSDPLLEALGPAHDPALAGASNAWAVDASRSSSQAPLLASDPHLWLSSPSVWYLADLSGGALTVAGGTLPGVPAVLIGHNGRVGWGLTTANVDDQDLYIERLNPENPEQYLTPDGWAGFASRRVRIEVAGEPDRIETLRTTRHGPVLSPEMFGAGTVTPEGHVAALAWTALTERDRGLTALHDLAHASRVEAAMEAGPEAVAPAQVVTLADRRRIAMVIAGAVPQRNPASPSQGRLPSPGWRAENDWLGLRPHAELPRVVDPREGAVAHANNRLVDDPYPDDIGHDVAAPYRIGRIVKELSGRRFHSRDSFVAMQADTVSEMARAVLPIVARGLWWRDGRAEGPALRREALERLFDWTGEMDQYAPEPLIFAEWMRALTRRLAEDELGGLFSEIEGPHPLFVERVFRDIDGASVWCDVDKTDEVETCEDMAVAALDDALATLVERHGTTLDGWRWGAAHRAVHRHMPLGYSDVGALFANIEIESSGGDHTIMRGLSTGRGPQPHANVHASGLRMVLDFADLDRSRAVISTGQSGHPFSRWYDHLAETWARGDTIPLTTSDVAIAAGSIGTMHLVPADP